MTRPGGEKQAHLLSPNSKENVEKEYVRGKHSRMDPDGMPQYLTDALSSLKTEIISSISASTAEIKTKITSLENITQMMSNDIRIVQGRQKLVEAKLEVQMKD
jgi:hypothetical protein